MEFPISKAARQRQRHRPSTNNQESAANANIRDPLKVLSSRKVSEENRYLTILRAHWTGVHQAAVFAGGFLPPPSKCRTSARADASEGNEPRMLALQRGRRKVLTDLAPWQQPCIEVLGKKLRDNFPLDFLGSNQRLANFGDLVCVRVQPESFRLAYVTLRQNAIRTHSAKPTNHATCLVSGIYHRVLDLVVVRDRGGLIAASFLVHFVALPQTSP